MVRLDLSYLKNLQAIDWKGLLKMRPEAVFGLDIGSSSVKSVRLVKEDDGYTVTSAAIAAITRANKDSSDNNGREADIVNAVKNCLHPQVGTQLAVCGVCGPEVAVRYFKFPSLSPEEVEGAVLLEASQVCPFDVSDGAVDYWLTPNGKDSACGVLVAAAGKLVGRKRKLAESASLNCVLMDVDGLALLNCFSEYEGRTRSGRTTAILNVGSSCTTVAVMNDDNLPFVRDIAYSGKDIISGIAAELNLSPEIVRDILMGRDDAGQTQAKLEDALAGASERLITEIADTLRYYMAQEHSNAVEQIFVCGGFALVRGFIGLLESRFTEKIVLWNPFETMRCSGGSQCEELLKEKGPAMVVAGGLAMRSI